VGRFLPVYVDRVRADNDACNEKLDHLAIGKVNPHFRICRHSRANRLHDELLQWDRWHAGDAARVLLAALKEEMGHVRLGWHGEGEIWMDVPKEDRVRLCS
jgi:hypothetical protein